MHWIRAVSQFFLPICGMYVYTCMVFVSVRRYVCVCVCACVCNDEVKAAVRRKEATWKEVLAANDE